MLTVVVCMFERVGLQTDLVKTKAMVCIPCLVWGNQGEAEYKWMEMGEEETFRERKRN